MSRSALYIVVGAHKRIFADQDRVGGAPKSLLHGKGGLPGARKAILRAWQGEGAFVQAGCQA